MWLSAEIVYNFNSSEHANSLWEGDQRVGLTVEADIDVPTESEGTTGAIDFVVGYDVFILHEDIWIKS